jgi:chromosome partitioning protein
MAEAGKIVAFVNLKGGVGKSTFAGHMTWWLHEQRKKVALVDTDLQRSSSIWMQRANSGIPVFAFQDAKQFIREVAPLREEFEVLVVDGPGGIEEFTLRILLMADLALVLCLPSAFDLRASDSAIQVIKQAQIVRETGKPVALFLANRVQNRTRLSTELLTTAQKIGIPMVKTAIHMRQVYADAPGQDTTVFAMGTRGKDAVEELNRVFQEVMDYGSTEDIG